MEKSIQYPRFINNSPCGEDLFEGKSQKNIAENISNIIETEKSCNIIGIDGGWGSGKSNLVKQVQNILSPKDYHFFIYDAWGHQEDLQRRSFLEELTENLTQENIVTEVWKQKLKKLLSKVKETESKRAPKLSIGVIVIAFTILLTPVFKSLADKIINNYWSFLVLSIPLLFIIAIYIYYYKQESEKKVLTRAKKAFTRLFLEYQNKLEEETKYEMISEDEPSVRKFRIWMTDISKDIGKKKLILVFDNMDRLPQKKVQELWSSIHVFFCENYYDNIKVIVPFDREHINLAFKSEDIEGKQYGDDFINKTFNVVYRVSPPILSDWKKYFIEQWEYAFGKKESIDENNNVLQIFDVLSEEITPRRIIAFINEFVSIKLTIKDTIPNNYIALFILGKHCITKKPIDEIIKPSFLKGLEYLYTNDEELPKFIASLFYQVDPEKAIQIVFTDRIKRALNENAKSDLEKISSIPEFYYILENAITDISNYENAILSLNELPVGKLGNNYQSGLIWECLYKKITPRPNSLISEYQLILLGKIKNQKEFLQLILNDLVSDPDFSTTNYFNSINAIDEKFKETLNVFSELRQKQTSVQEFINFIDHAKSEYSKYKVSTDQKELNDYLISMDVSKLDEVDYIPYLKGKYQFLTFTKDLEDRIKKNVANNDRKVMSILFSRYKEVSSEKPLKEKLDDSSIYTLFTGATEKEDFYYDLIAMRIAKLDKFNASYASLFDPILQVIDENMVKKIAERLEYYLPYGNLLLGLKSFNDPLVKLIAKSLTVSPVGSSRASILSIVSNFQDICKLGEIEPKTLLERMDNWISFLKSELTKENVKQTVSPYFLMNSINESYSICTHCIDTVNLYLNSLTEDDWKTAFKDLESYEIKVSLIIDYKFSTNASEAIKDVFKDVAVSSIPIPDKLLMDNIISKLHEQGKSLKGTFNTVRDTFCREDGMTIPLFVFFGDWLFRYADLEQNPSSLRTIFTSDVIRDNDCLQIILNNQNKMPAIISSANEEAQDFLDIIKEILTNNPSESFVSFAKKIGVELDQNNEDNSDKDSKQ